MMKPRETHRYGPMLKQFSMFVIGAIMVERVIEVITGRERRRRWSVEENAAFVSLCPTLHRDVAPGDGQYSSPIAIIW